MNYFGGIGAGKGWYKFKFILTPSELYELLTSYQLVVLNTGRVPTSYRFTTTKAYVQQYENYYKCIFSGNEYDKKQYQKVESSIYKALIDSEKKIRFNHILDKNGKQLMNFKLTSTTEVVISIRPIYLSIHQSTLSLSTHHLAGSIGLELNYPKVITLAEENHEVLHETKHFAMHNIYHNLIEQIKSNTQKIKIVVNNKIKRPNLWVSQQAKTDMLHHLLIKQHNIKLI